MSGACGTTLSSLYSPVSCRKRHFPICQNPALLSQPSAPQGPSTDWVQPGFPISSAGKSPFHTHSTPSSHPRACGMCRTPTRGHSPPLGAHRVDPWGEQDQGLTLLTAGRAVGVSSSIQACPVPALPRGARFVPGVPKTWVTAVSFFTQTMETCSQLGGSPVKLRAFKCV